MLVDGAATGIVRRPNATARNKILPLAATVVALTLQAPTAASVNTQEWNDVSGNVVTSVDKDGRLTAANLTLTSFAGVLKASAGVVAGSATTSDLPEGSNLYYTDERVDDRVAALLLAGAGISLTYNDVANSLTVASTVTQYTDEMAQDTIATLLQNGTGISWSYNDVANTLTPTVTLSPFTTTDLAEGTHLYYTDARAQAAITGTASRITLTAGVVDISASYVGQASITTLGTIGTGTWNATAIADGKIASALTGKTYNALTLTALATGFTIAGGTTSKTLTVPLDASVSGTNTGDQTTVSGNAGTATALQTARAINGVNFDGTADITVTAAAGTLTGTTLKSTVVSSSLTSVGTLATLTVTATITGSVSGNAGTVTTNANLTGPITSSGNATSIASQTGTGTTFVMSAGPSITGTLAAASGTYSGTLTVTSTFTVGDGTGTRSMVINGAAGGNRNLNFWTNGSTRWLMQADATAEGGSNAGSTFKLLAYDDAGSNIDTPITIVRASGGAMTLARPVTASSTTDSTTTSTGGLIVSGGIGVAKRITLDGATGKTLRITNAVANAAVAVTLGAGPTGSTAGNPQGWMRIDIAGTDRYIPFW